MEVFCKPTCINSKQLLKKRKRAQLHTFAANSPTAEEATLGAMDMDCKRQIHSKIEKRRRDKMNNYINQLAAMIPTHNSSTHKPDRITVLKMAVRYLKSIRTSPLQFNAEENLEYSFINDLELKKLMLQVSEGFLFVVGCESARILYVSKSVSQILKCNDTDLLGCSLYDVIHPQDTVKVKEQISCVDLNPRHQFISIKSAKDLNVDMPSEQLGTYPGNRRSFFFRIKTNIGGNQISPGKCPNYPYDFKCVNEPMLLDDNIAENNQFTVIQCTGYLKCWNSFNYKINLEEEVENGDLVTAFIAVGREIKSNAEMEQKNITFVSKFTTDGKFLFVDHGVTMATGYLPQEISGTNIYDYIHMEDVNDFAMTHQSMLQFPADNIINTYRFRTKYGTFIRLQSEWRSLQNPWRKEVEYYYCKTTTTWDSDTKLTLDKLKGNVCFLENEMCVPVEENEANRMMDFNHQNMGCLKADNANILMDAILKLLECDANIAD